MAIIFIFYDFHDLNR